jgi:hypothetical protein
MWSVYLGNSISAQAAPEHYVHNVYEQKYIKDTITYLHACCFSPVQDTWIEAIKNGHFATWASVTVAKLLPLPHPPVRARTDARTNPSAQRATQLRSVLACVYAVSIQNQITNTVP